jgi:hypothetical protein
LTVCRMKNNKRGAQGETNTMRTTPSYRLDNPETQKELYRK